ncbi:MAG: hypothetical protein ABI743_02830 [bacterium]
MRPVMLVLPCLAGAALACGGGNTVLPTPAADPGAQAMATAVDGPAPQSRAAWGGLPFNSATGESTLGLLRLTIDPATLSATVADAALRSAQQTDDQYQLDIAKFLAPADFTITGVEGTADTLDIHYTVRHPFAAASQLDFPATAVNREDLSIAGRVLFMADVPTPLGHTFFTGTDQVVANTALCGNPDGYYKPAGLVNTTGFNANTFPFKALVDETLDARTTRKGTLLSNNLDMAGNYLSVTGWDRSNISTTNDGWTGYGILHQGQAASNTLSIRRSALGDSAFSLDVVVLAKYTDPRGGLNSFQKRANRLPPQLADIHKFVYREPHGALDLEKIEFLGATGDYWANVVSASVLQFHLVDWDARALESSLTNLAEDDNIMRVPQGASGAPTLSVCIPGVLGNDTVVVPMGGAALTDDDAMWGGDTIPDTGKPRDPLYYQASLTKLVLAGQTAGTYTGMVRVEDPENLIDTSDWYTPLNGLTNPPSPLPGNVAVPRAVVYQAFPITLINAPSIPPTCTFTGPTTVLSGLASTTSIEVLSAGDPNADPITVEIDWDGGADSFIEAGVIAPPYAPLPMFTSPPGLFVNTTLNPQERTINIRYTDGNSGLITAPDHLLSLDSNRAPQVLSGTIGLADSNLVSNGNFRLISNELLVSDPEGDAVTYLIRGNGLPLPSLAATGTEFPIACGPFSRPPTTNGVRFTGYAGDQLHPGTAGVPLPTAVTPLTGFVASGSNFVAPLLSDLGGVCNILDTVYSSTTGNYYLCGSFTGDVDLDPGPGSQIYSSPAATSGFVIALDNAGDLQWIAPLMALSSGTAEVTALTLDPSSGLPIAAGTFNLTLDFNPTGGTAFRTATGADGFVWALTSGGGLSWVDTTDGLGTEEAIVDLAPSGVDDILVLGSFAGQVDFDPAGGLVVRNALGVADTFLWTLHGPTGNYQDVITWGGAGATTIGSKLANSAANDTVFVTGNWTGTTDFNPQGAITARTSVAGTTDFFIMALDDNNLEWVQTFGSTSNDSTVGLALSNDGDPRLSGAFFTPLDFDPGGGTQTRIPNGSQDAYFLGLDGNTGQFQFVAVWGGATGTDLAGSIFNDGADNYFIACEFESDTDFNIGPGSDIRTSHGGTDAACLVLSDAGGYLRCATWGGSGHDSANHLWMRPDQQVGIAGAFEGPVDFDPGERTHVVTSGLGRSSYLMQLFPDLGF